MERRLNGRIWSKITLPYKVSPQIPLYWTIVSRDDLNYLWKLGVWSPGGLRLSFLARLDGEV